MPLQDEQRVSNLVFFLRERPHFSGQAASESGQKLSESYMSFAALESFFWLHLGVQFQYFPKTEARRVTYEYFPRLLAAYEHAQKHLLLQRFTPPLLRILDLEFGGRAELFSRNDGLGDYPEEMLAPFQTFLILGNTLAGDIETESFSDSLLFLNSAMWKKGMSEFYEAKSINDSKSQQFIDARNSMSTVVFKIVQYMESFRETLLDFDQISKNFEGKSFALIPAVKQRVKEIQSWRLNFGEQRVSDRFLEFVNVALSFYSHEASQDAIEFQRTITPSLVRSIRLLMTDWGGTPMAFEVGVH